MTNVLKVEAVSRSFSGRQVLEDVTFNVEAGRMTGFVGANLALDDERLRLGGDVEAGLAIAEMIASMKKPTVSLVLGGGHSIGVPLATAAKRSFIVPSATMTWPACREYPIPTPPPWWSETQVAPPATFIIALR